MRVLHSASRIVAAAALLAFAAGCSSDSTAPDAPFDPAGTSADIAAVDESFQAPALEAYAAASPSISAVVGGSIAAAVKASPSGAIARSSQSGSLAYATALARTYTGRGLRPSFSTAASIPAEYLGVTFEYDVNTDTYAASDLSGAPSNGVRFMLYAVNPVTNVPIEPLVELGHVDFTETQTQTSLTVRAVVVSGGVTYLDYTVAAAVGTSAITIGVGGYATNGTDRVNFDLDHTLSDGAGETIDLAYDYLLTVPTRGGFRIDLEQSVTGFLGDAPVVTLDLEARGDHGTVRIHGSTTDAAGSFQVDVNGDLFATITVTGEALPTLVGAGGQPLSQAEQDVLWAIWYIFAQGFDFFEDLTDPVGVAF